MGEIEREFDEERKRKRKRKKRHKKKRKKRRPQITEDTLRMLAEQQGKKYKPDIDIDQGLESEDSDISDDSEGDHDKRRILKKRVMEHDEESVMGYNQNEGESDDDFHDYPEQKAIHKKPVNNVMANNDDDNFVVNDMANNFRNFYENDQIEKLYGIFGKNIYEFLGIPNIMNVEEESEEEENKININEQNKKEEEKKKKLNL